MPLTTSDVLAHPVFKPVIRGDGRVVADVYADLCTVETAADALGCDEPFVWDLVARGQIRAVDITKNIVRVLVRSLRDYIEERNTPAAVSRNPGLPRMPSPHNLPPAYEPTGYIYFIQAGDGGPIKIGYARDPKKRLGDLQVGNPHPLHLRGTVPGNRQFEADLQAALEKHRLRGEWFSPDENLVIVLTRLLNEGWSERIWRA